MRHLTAARQTTLFEDAPDDGRWSPGQLVSSNWGRRLCRYCGQTFDPVDMTSRHQCRGCARDRERHCRQAKPDQYQETSRRWREANGERHREGSRQWHHENRERSLAKSRAFYEHNPGHYRRSLLKCKYGITPDDYARLLADQGGVCAICGQEPAGKMLAVDHDHSTGRIRGLLHGGCNLGLGHFRDRPELLEAAATYLREHATPELEVLG